MKHLLCYLWMLWKTAFPPKPPHEIKFEEDSRLNAALIRYLTGDLTSAQYHALCDSIRNG